MKLFNLLIIFVLFSLFLVGCGGLSGDSTTISPYVQELAFAQDNTFYSQEDQIIVLYLESVADPSPPAADTGGVGDDRVKVKLTAKTGHEFKLDVPAGELFTMTVTDPGNVVVAFLDKNTPLVAVDVVDGIYTLVVTHGGGTANSRTLFIRPGSTISSIDCPNCNLTNVDLTSHNLSNANLSGANLSGANLEYADLTGAVRVGTNMENALTTGMTGMAPAPTTSCANTDADCYTVYPAAETYTISPGNTGKDYAQITINQYDDHGVLSNNGTTIGSNSDTPVTVKLPDGYHWRFTIENSFKGIPYYTTVASSNSTGWDFEKGCTSSSKQAPNSLCGGSSLLDIQGPKEIRTLMPAESNGSLLANRMYLLDQKNGNYLFRGPMPTVQGTDKKWTFDYPNLIANLKQKFTTQMGKGSIFPPKFKFIEISLINDTGEKDMLQAEYEFFGGSSSMNPTLYSSQPAGDGFKTINSDVQGQFWWWNIQPMVTGAQNSKIGDLASKISGWMDTDNTAQDATPYIIYFHCASGTDRTGEIAISYLLKGRAMSSNEAYIYGSTHFIVAGSGLAKSRLLPNKDYRIGAAWYNCTLCNQNNGDLALCGDIAGNCPNEDASSCSTCKNGLSAACQALSCWNFSNSNDIPGGGSYPNPYPWSTKKAWEAAGCSP